MKTLVLLLAAFAASAAAQAPAPAEPKAQSQDAPPKPRPPLKLNLDEIDPPHSRITFTPRDDQKQDPAASLPGMGGSETRTWQRPSNQVFPPDTNPNAR